MTPDTLTPLSMVRAVVYAPGGRIFIISLAVTSPAISTPFLLHACLVVVMGWLVGWKLRRARAGVT